MIYFFLPLFKPSILHVMLMKGEEVGEVGVHFAKQTSQPDK